MEVIASSEVAPERLLPIDEIVTGVPALPDDVRAIACFVAAYYQEPIGLCLAQMLPPLVVARRAAPAAAATASRGAAHALNVDQQAAVDAALAEPWAFAPSLIQGVTGSGKTEVYLAAAARVIAAGMQVMLLVPEINLTPQLVDRIQGALPDARTAVLHSRLAAGERQRQWLATASGDVDLLVGTRLAVFTPMPRLGLIIVDEEQDTSFKQQEGVRYHARDVAIYRARLRDIPIDARQCDAVPGKLRTGNTGTLPLGEAAAQGRARRGASGRANGSESRSGQRRRNRTRTPGSDRGAACARRADVVVRQPTRLRSIAVVRGMRLEGNVPSLRRASGCTSRPRTAVLPSLRSHEGDSHCVPRLRQSGPAAAGVRHPASRARRRRIVSCGADRTRRSRQHAPQGFVWCHAHRDRGRRRGHHDRNADARQRPRFSAPDTGWRTWRRQRAVQRRISRDRAVVRAARAGRGSRGPRCPGR